MTKTTDHRSSRTSTDRCPTDGIGHPRSVAVLHWLLVWLATSAAPELANASTGLTLYSWDPIQTARVLPDTPLPAAYASRIDVRATPGEVEPASFVIHSAHPLSNVTLAASPLRNASAETELDPSVIDVRVVKVWFQAGDHFGMFKGKEKVFVSELLLKDDDLIRVDQASRKQWIRVKKESGIDYHLISDPASAIPTDAELHDANELQPFSIEENESKQIWLTIRVPDDALPGHYTGHVTVAASEESRAKIEINLEVLPFRLQPSRIETSLYYRGMLWSDEPKPRDYRFKDPDAYLWDMKNLADHGVLNPTFTHYGSDPPHGFLETELRLRRNAGMPKGAVYVTGLTLGKPSQPLEFAALERKVRHWVRWFKDRGYGPVYFYAIDEAKNDQLTPQLAGWRLTHSLGGRVMAACYVGSAKVAAGSLDMPIIAYKLDPEEAKRYHERGARVYSYANPQVGLEDPLVYRRNYGFALWRAGYDGSMTYAYQDAFGDIWNDFDGDGKYRDHVFAYPTDGGVIDTIQWEGFREAADDLRYLATLQERINASSRESDRRRLNQWLDELDTQQDPHLVRSLIIKKLLELDDSL